MGFSSEKPTTGSWAVAAGISLRAPLKPIYTGGGAVLDDDERETEATTPTSEGSRIPAKLPCPPPPRKRSRATNNSKCNNKMFSNGKMEFFVTPPDLEAVFIRRHVGC